MLRGINVGGRNPVPMARLREVFAEADCDSVATYIQSGNVVFASVIRDRGRLVKQLEAAVDASFGVPAKIILRTPAELATLVKSHPFGADTSKTHVAFLGKPPTKTGIDDLEALDIGADRFMIAGSDVYLQFPNGISGAKLVGPRLERHLGTATVRNWRTVCRLLELSGA